MTSDEILQLCVKHYKDNKFKANDIFNNFSTDKQTVKKEDFKKKIAQQVKGIDTTQADILFDSLSREHTDGKIPKTDFLQRFYGATMTGIINPIRLDLDFNEQLKQVFKLVANNNTNVDSIDRRQLKICSKKLGLNMNAAELDSLFDNFKGEGAGEELKFEPFKRLIEFKFVSSLINRGELADKIQKAIQDVTSTRDGFIKKNQIQ